ncbi:MAG: hypothetical protein H7832_00085 [Magnetococcus sp. DMHC-6]
MSYNVGSNPYVTEEQRIYAQWLGVGWKTGFVIMVLFFLLYISGALPPYIPLDQVDKYWAMSAPEYLKSAQLHTGWSWIYLIDRGDFLNFGGIAFLAIITSICFLRLLPEFIRQKDKIFTTIVVLETIILSLAASGILVVGH